MPARFTAAVMQRKAPSPSGGGDGDVVGVARQAVADHLGVDLRAARLGVLVFLEHDDAGALAHDEAVAVLVVGARGLRRASSLKPVESARQAQKPAIAEAVDRRFGAARHHHVGVAERDQAAGVADRVRAGRAGRDDGVVRTLEAVLDRDVAGGEIDEPARE